MKENEILLENIKEKFKERYIELHKNDYEIEYEYADNEDENEESEGFTQTDFEVEKSLEVLEDIFDYIINSILISKEIDEGLSSCDKLKRKIELLQKEYDDKKCGSEKLTNQLK
ncbi:TPA: hypothetical protein ACPPHM_001870 [Haemophilus influenzae]